MQILSVRFFPEATARVAPSAITFNVKAEEKMAAKRELINTGTDKRYVRRDSKGRFNESDDVGKSLSQDRRRKAKTKVKAGQGDRGDR